MAYKYLFRNNQPWSPNLNSEQRLIPIDDGQRIEVPETTIDLKEYLTLSWNVATERTQSDILIISGTAVQTRMYTSANGEPKDIEKDTGLARSQPDGSAKQPHKLPETATKSWDLEFAVADQYVLKFDGGSVDPDLATLGYNDEGNWKPFTQEDCVINKSYSPKIFNQLNSLRNEACDGEFIVGYDNIKGNHWWVVLNSDVEVALIERQD